MENCWLNGAENMLAKMCLTLVCIVCSVVVGMCKRCVVRSLVLFAIGRASETHRLALDRAGFDMEKLKSVRNNVARRCVVLTSCGVCCVCLLLVQRQIANGCGRAVRGRTGALLRVGRHTCGAGALVRCVVCHPRSSRCFVGRIDPVGHCARSSLG